MNKSIFIGRMATDPKVMSSAGKKTVAYFRIAVERNFKQEELRMLITLAVSHLGKELSL